MEVGLAVGGAFLSSALNVLFDRLAPQGELLNMFRKHKDHARLLKKLKMTLRGLQIVLSDAENKQASNPSVRDWLNELRDAVDSAENLIEEVNYEALRLKVEGQHQNLTETSNYQQEKLEGTIETLKDLQKQIGDLGLKEHFGSTKQETRTPSTSLVDDSDIFGRQKEIKDLIDRLLSEDASGGNLTVVPIVGMGGAGKTTLAKAVYNDEKVKNHFGLKAWYCVSEPYDALRITKGLLQEIGSFDSKDDGNLNQLQVKLKESLKGKKFLVVLDDVWNDDYNEWDNLRNVFVQGDMGSKIIVTTRKESVAQTMCADRCTITVGTLSSEDSWALFKRHSLENRDHPELEEVGKEIADKCKGLPLALKTVAGTLRGKSEVDEWRDILSSKIWEQPSSLKGILPALMLSYNDLPPDLKQSFAFCAIYPKDYVFCKDQVGREQRSGSTAYDSQTEREILDELHPHTNIKQVEITGYRGKKISNWLADPLFLKLVQLSLSDCKDCDSLPALGQLPSLKFLSIRGMHGITEVTEEFYGNSSSKKPFNSLEKLDFADMPEWKQWHVLGSGEFPLLEYLSIEKCPKLMGKLPENLSSLTTLRISETPLFEEAQLFRSQFEGMKQIVELEIRDCNSLTSLPFSILPSSLKRITISNCRRLKLEEPVGYCNMFLEELTLAKCDCIDEFLPRARKLSISSCQNVTRFLIPTATESLCIFSCKNLEILSVAVESAMTSLDIYNCVKLKCLPEIELFNLQVLKISDCKKLVNGRKEWCLQRLPCLTELKIFHDGSDEEIQHWELPSSITSLRIGNLKTLSSQVLKSLTSLQYLLIDNLPQIQSLLEEGRLPSSLSELDLCYHDRLHSLHLCHLTSLLSLHIFNCPNLQSLSESTLPSSLSKLTLQCCNLQSLSKSALPSSLSQLTIWNCPNLQSLPVKGIPSSLSKLSIRHCPLLTPLLEFDEGKYWPNIAQIPTIFINRYSH
ncbi:hypothetical protein KY284_008489 [Solanum tuberosum]|nr:hypothetical protein KY284_008489 [Solanum tuberosum]